jgi:hypothetical protein
MGRSFVSAGRFRIYASRAAGSLRAAVDNVDAAMSASTAVDDPGYDWFAPSVQGEASPTPELDGLARRILNDRHDAGADSVRTKVGFLRRLARRILTRRQKPIRLTFLD